MSISLLFYVAKQQASKKTGKTSLYLRIIKDRKKAEAKVPNLPALNATEFAKWIPEKESFKGSEYIHYNAVIVKLKEKFTAILSDELNYYDDAKGLRDKLLAAYHVKHEPFFSHMEKTFEKVMIPRYEMSPGTIRNKRKSLRHLKAFLIEQKKIDVGLYSFGDKESIEFKQYLLERSGVDRKGMKHVSAKSIVKVLRSIYNELCKEIPDLKRKIVREPFVGISFIDDGNETLPLSKEDLIKVQNVELKIDRLDLHRDKFLFMCYTGLSHKDVLSIKRSDIQDGFLQFKRAKSNILTSQVLVDRAKEILNKYGDYPEIEITDSLFPKVSLDKTNVNLKVIGGFAKTSVTLSTKLARVFFREALYEVGVSEIIIRKAMMGHSQGFNIDKHYLRASKDKLEAISVKLNKYFTSVI